MDGVDESDGAANGGDGSRAGAEMPDSPSTDDEALDRSADTNQSASDRENRTDDSLAEPVRNAFETFRQRPRKQQLLRAGGLVTVFGLIVLIAVVPTGILGLVVNDSTTFAAAPATPGNGVLDETGYERTDANTTVVKRQISPAGQERTILVRNKQRIYRSSRQVQNSSFDAGVFVTLSSPRISIAGSEQNPLASESHRDLLGRFESRLDTGDEDLTFEKVGQRDAALVGQSTSVSEFRTTMTANGEQREFAVYVTTARSDGDIVVAVGLHPIAFADERVSIMRLLYAVQHPGG